MVGKLKDNVGKIKRNLVGKNSKDNLRKYSTKNLPEIKIILRVVHGKIAGSLKKNGGKIKRK